MNKASRFTSCTKHTGLPGCASGKEFSCQSRGHRRCEFDPWVGKPSGVENEDPLQYSCLGNPWRGAWWAIVPGGDKESNMTECTRTHTHTHTKYIHTNTHTHTHQIYFATGAPPWSLEMSVSFPSILIRKWMKTRNSRLCIR